MCCMWNMLVRFEPRERDKVNLWHRCVVAYLLISSVISFWLLFLQSPPPLLLHILCPLVTGVNVCVNVVVSTYIARHWQVIRKIKQEQTNHGSHPCKHSRNQQNMQYLSEYKTWGDEPRINLIHLIVIVLKVMMIVMIVCEFMQHISFSTVQDPMTRAFSNYYQTQLCAPNVRTRGA